MASPLYGSDVKLSWSFYVFNVPTYLRVLFIFNSFFNFSTNQCSLSSLIFNLTGYFDARDLHKLRDFKLFFLNLTKVTKILYGILIQNHIFLYDLQLLKCHTISYEGCNATENKKHPLGKLLCESKSHGSRNYSIPKCYFGS